MHAIRFFTTLLPHTDILLYIFKELSGFTRSYCPSQVGRMSILAYIFFIEVDICLNILGSKNDIQRKCKAKITQQCRAFFNVFYCFSCLLTFFLERRLNINNYINNNNSGFYLLDIYNVHRW